jgi:Protein of unknown function (DUF2934)
MAKSTRSNEGDTSHISAGRPVAGRRRTDRQPKPANGEPASGPNPSPGTPDQFGRQDLVSRDTQDLSPAPPSERDETIPSEPSEHEIRLRAYLRYLDRGAFDGADFDDWLQAEIELKKR